MDVELICRCREADTIFIYGAGTVADIFFIFLKKKKMHHKVSSFVVTESGGNVQSKSGLKTVEFHKIIPQLQRAFVVIAVQHFIQVEIADQLMKNHIYNFGYVNSEELLNEFYNELYQKPICSNKIFFQNQSGMGYGGNPKYIAEKILELDKDQQLDLIWAVSKHREGIPEKIRQVFYGSQEYYEELATSRLWIDNSRKPYSVRKRKGQFYVQTWHGAAPVKRVEADVQDKLPDYYIESAKKDSEMADVFLSGSAFYTQLYRKSFWYDGIILEFGLPRHDVFWNTKIARNKVYDFYNIKKDVSIALYAPTFRRHYGKECYDLDIDRIRQALEKKFHNRFQMLVSRHPGNHQEYSLKKNAEYLYVGDYEDFQELLAAADILITDYSGCMYDFSYTRRPVFLYQRDYEEYLQDRNFYIPMEELPYIKVHSNEEFEDAIRDFDMDKYVLELTTFMNSMGNYDDGSASEKVVKFLIEQVIGFQHR